MGWASMIGSVSSLWVNGQLKGLYNPAEKMDPIFLSQVPFPSPSLLPPASSISPDPFSPSPSLPPHFLPHFIKNYFVSESSKWDIMHMYTPQLYEDGDMAFYAEMRDFALTKPASDPLNYKFFIDNYVEIDQFIDYMMLNTYSPSYLLSLSAPPNAKLVDCTPDLLSREQRLDWQQLVRCPPPRSFLPSF